MINDHCDGGGFVVHCGDDGIGGSDGDGVHFWNEDIGDDDVLKLVTSWVVWSLIVDTEWRFCGWLILILVLRLVAGWILWLQVRQRKAFGRRVADLQTVQVVTISISIIVIIPSISFSRYIVRCGCFLCFSTSSLKWRRALLWQEPSLTSACNSIRLPMQFSNHYIIKKKKKKHKNLFWRKQHIIHTTQVGKCGNELASMAKYWTTELENKVAADCLQLHGGWGFMWETQIAKAYASARVQVGQILQTKYFPKLLSAIFCIFRQSTEERMRSWRS